MAKSNNMKDLLKQRMSAAQQVSEMEIGNRAYESLIDPLPVAASTIRELPVDKLRPFFTTDIGFHPYSPDKLRAFSQQLLEQGLLERITTSWDSGCITELYADYDMARFAMLKGIREEQAEGCVKDWAERDALEEEYCTDFYEAWHRDEYFEKHFTASIEKLSLTLPQRIIAAE